MVERPIYGLSATEDKSEWYSAATAIPAAAIMVAAIKMIFFFIML